MTVGCCSQWEWDVRDHREQIEIYQENMAADLFSAELMIPAVYLLTRETTLENFIFRARNPTDWGCPE